MINTVRKGTAQGTVPLQRMEEEHLWNSQPIVAAKRQPDRSTESGTALSAARLGDLSVGFRSFSQVFGFRYSDFELMSAALGQL